MSDTDSNHSQAAAQQQWDEIVRLAWRPAWSIRSRKGCLAPFVSWWRQRRRVADNAGMDSRRREE